MKPEVTIVFLLSTLMLVGCGRATGREAGIPIDGYPQVTATVRDRLDDIPGPRQLQLQGQLEEAMQMGGEDIFWAVQEAIDTEGSDAVTVLAVMLLKDEELTHFAYVWRAVDRLFRDTGNAFNREVVSALLSRTKVMEETLRETYSSSYVSFAVETMESVVR